MSTPITETIQVVRGDDDDKLITFSVDVVNFEEVWFTVREGWRTNEDNDGSVVFQASLANGRLQAYSAAQLLLLLPHTETERWGFDEYVFDVQVRTTTSKILTTERGPLRMVPDVTASVA